ncbi:MAG: CinA family protein [Candidatus Methanoplasma sp.]|jgi:nicotinamide-nucleotide amidase|nr:CinA family protein [Candidatus Methanoplasma sp.]
MTEDFDLRLAAANIASLLTGRHTLSVAESCTGGFLGATLTDVPGASGFFIGGAAVYSNHSKEKVLGVAPLTLKRFGSVSAEVAKEMAEGAVRTFGSDLSVAITGISGPGGGSPQKPVGLAFIAVSDGRTTKIEEFRFSKDRNGNRQESVWHAMKLLSEFVGD